MQCPHCGVTLPSDARFCAGCGQAIPGAKGPAPVGGTSSAWILVLAIGAGGLMFVAVLGIIAAIAIPNLLNAIDRGKQKRTMADMRTLGAAIDAYALDHRTYPDAEDIDTLRPQLIPAYAATLPTLDGWGRPFAISSDEDGYEIVSLGKDGVEQGCDGGGTGTFAEDICYSDGEFTQWPSAVPQEPRHKTRNRGRMAAVPTDSSRRPNAL